MASSWTAFSSMLHVFPWTVCFPLLPLLLPCPVPHHVMQACCVCNCPWGTSVPWSVLVLWPHLPSECVDSTDSRRGTGGSDESSLRPVRLQTCTVFPAFTGMYGRHCGPCFFGRVAMKPCVVQAPAFMRRMFHAHSTSDTCRDEGRSHRRDPKKGNSVPFFRHAARDPERRT